ncbi:MAG: DsbA family protein [Nocardioides sp.]
MSKTNREESRTQRAAAALIAQRRRERRRNLLVGAVVAVVVLAVVGVGFLLQSNRDTAGRAATAPQGVTDGYVVTVGKATAPRTVTVYEDFQCPICREFEAATKDKLRAGVAAGKIKIDYHMVAFLDRSSTTRYSSRALNAAAVVLDTSGVDVFEKFHDLLYAHQPAEGSAGLSDAQLVQYAVEAGASESAVKAGIQDDTYHQWVVNATDQMSKNGVNGTPTVEVDGKRAGATLPEAITAALNAVS